jgi:low affinity Fe/Cu permease
MRMQNGKVCGAKDRFRRISCAVAESVGSYWAFGISILFILLWATTGPIFHFSDTWQLVINTATTIITFLMVFLIQNTQNRDAKAIHLKLDELIRSTSKARNTLVNLENLTDEEMAELQKEFARVQERAQSRTKQNGARHEEGRKEMPERNNGKVTPEDLRAN